MANELSFTLKLLDRMSAPAKAATTALSMLESQLKSVNALLKDMPKLSLKVPKVIDHSGGSGVSKQAKQAIGPMFGPGRKEAVASAKFAERMQAAQTKAVQREELKRVKAAESLDKQRSSALLRQFKEAERAKVKAAAKAAKETADIRKKALSHFELPGGKGALADISKFAGAGPETAAAIGTIGVAAAAATVAVLALGAGVLYLTGSAASLAIQAAEAKNDTLDMLEAMLGSQEAAKSTYEQINAITKVVAISQESAETLARELTAAGVTNQAMLVGAVKAIGQTESVLKGAGSKIQGIIEKAAQTGKFEVNAKKLTGTGVQLSVLYAELARRTGNGAKQIEAQLKAGKISAETGIAALTSVLDTKFGAVAAKQAMDIGAQFQRFHDNVSRLFEDVDTEPFLKGLNEILSLVDQSTVAGSALHEVFTAAFDGLFRAIAVVEPYAKAFFRGLIIIGLQVAIALKPLMKQLGLTFGGDQQANAMKLAKVMSAVGAAIGWVTSKFVGLITNTTVWNTLGYALKGILATILGVITLVGIAFGALVAIWSVGAAVLTALGTAIFAAIGWLGEISSTALAAGGDFVSGLIDGITNAAGQLYDTVKNLALGALDKFKSFFGIASPSKVMAKMGGHLTAGLSKGITSTAGASSGAMVGAGASLGAKTAQGSQLALLDHMPRPMAGNDNGLSRRAEQPRLAEPAKQRQSTSGPVFQAGAFAQGAFVFQFQDSKDFEERAPEILANVFEQAALMRGTGSG